MDALKYILEWAAAVCTVIPHLYVQFVQSLADAIGYNWEWAATVCTAGPHLSVQFSSHDKKDHECVQMHISSYSKIATE